MEFEDKYGEYLDILAKVIHHHNEKWWTDIHTGEPLDRNKGETIALIHSEISEAPEGVRKNLMDDKLPEYKVEMADAVIRILDYCAGYGLPLGQALIDKCRYNQNREDHKIENRLKDNGKKI